MPAIGKESFFEIDFNDCVHVVQFCPCELSSHLVLIGTSSKIQLGSLKFQDIDIADGEDEKEFQYTVLQDIHHGQQVMAAAWSPETSMFSVPKLLRFATAAVDNTVTIFTTDLKSNVQKMPIYGHKDYVNAICFEPDSGGRLATVSDDMSCRVWDLAGTIVLDLPLRSPGIAVEWPDNDPHMLVVAEQQGTIHVYNIMLNQPVMSLFSTCNLLRDMSMNIKNPASIAVACSNHILTYDSTESSYPLSTWTSHAEACMKVLWCRSHEKFLACIGQPNYNLKIYDTKSQKVIVEKELQFASGLTWHQRLPILVVGGDRKVHVWKLDF